MSGVQRIAGAKVVEEKAASSLFLVEWREGDHGNPANWSRWRKWIITVSACTVSANGAAISSVIALGYPSMKAELGCSDEQAAAALALYAFGYAITPLVFSAFSEEFGRRPLYIGTSVLFTILFIPIALATDIKVVILVRFLQGCAGSTGSAMVGGTLADIWKTSERGHPMSLFSSAVFFMPGLGSCIAGFIEQTLHWRWIQWIGMCFSGFLTLWLILYGAPETRGSIILERRAHKLRRSTGDVRFQTAAGTPDLRALIWLSLTRPLKLLLTEPIVLSFSVWLGFVWGFLYCLLESIGLVFTSLYGFKPGEVGLAYLSLSAGTLLGLIVNWYQEKLYRTNYARRGVEARLYSACAGGIIFSAGGFIYGWTSSPSIHWIAPCIGISITITGLFTIYKAAFNYLADSYLLYASSALAGQSLMRNLMGTAFPLFTTQMYRSLGFHWGGTLVALIAAILAPIPFVLFYFGPRIRARSKFAQTIQLVEKGGAPALEPGEKEDLESIPQSIVPPSAL